MKIVTVVGARPQFVKASAVSRKLAECPGVTELLVHTGQHYDENMSAIFFSELGIPLPHFQLGIGSGGHGAQTGRMLAAIEQVLLETQPDWVLIYGDTNSTLAGALAAAKLHIPVAHVEAGLRSHNRQMPEELNRVLADHASDWLLTPTESACANLLREGLPAARIRQVGDVMYDVALHYAQQAEQRVALLDRLGLRSGSYVLATIHRAENTDDPARLRHLAEGLMALAAELPVVLPLHPRTRKVLGGLGLLSALAARVKVLEPLGYLEMLLLEKHARLIATDSGGVQKEAFFFGVPCATLRDETEWGELVELGWNRLLPPTSAQAVGEGLLAQLAAPPGQTASPYGDGRAAEAIVELLLSAATRPLVR